MTRYTKYQRYLLVDVCNSNELALQLISEDRHEEAIKHFYEAFRLIRLLAEDMSDETFQYNPNRNCEQAEIATPKKNFVQHISEPISLQPLIRNHFSNFEPTEDFCAIALTYNVALCYFQCGILEKSRQLLETVLSATIEELDHERILALKIRHLYGMLCVKFSEELEFHGTERLLYVASAAQHLLEACKLGEKSLTKNYKLLASAYSMAGHLLAKAGLGEEACAAFDEALKLYHYPMRYSNERSATSCAPTA